MISDSSPRVLAKLLIGEMKSPEIMARSRELESQGFKSQRPQIIFLCYIYVMVNLYNHPVVEFVHYKTVNVLSCA